MIRSFLLFSWLLLSPILSAGQAAQESWTLKIGGASKGLHIPPGISSIVVEPAFEDYSDMMFQICDALKLEIKEGECLIYPLMTNELSPGALATVADGNNIIIYDRTLSGTLGYAGAMGVIAHEIGHHYCKHLDTPLSSEQELEADIVVGATMRLAGYSVADALAMTKILAERSSASHPGREDRKKAIENGFHNPELAKSCNRHPSR